MRDGELNYRKVIGKRVRIERVWRALSQDELAHEAGVTRNFVSAIERGAQGLDAYRLGLIAKALGIKFEDLMATDDRRLR